MATLGCFKTPGSVTYMLHHVFFPLKLPGGDDYDPQLDKAIIECVISALESFRHEVSPAEHSTVDQAREMVEKLKLSKDEHGFVCQSELLLMFQRIEPGMTPDASAHHVLG